MKRKINRLAALFELADQEFVNIKVDTEERERELIEVPVTPKDEDVVSKSKELSNVTKTLLELIEKYSGTNERALDAFQFLAVVKKDFPSYEFIPYQVDGFVQEIDRISPDFTQGELSTVINEQLTKVNQYAEYQSTNYFNLNPYTIIRHALYLSDKDKFKSILFDRQRVEFDKWLANSDGH